MNKKPIIFLIDDHEHTRFIYQEMLQEKEYTVIAATNSADAALFYAMAYPDIDLVLLDSNIFHYNGAACLQ